MVSFVRGWELVSKLRVGSFKFLERYIFVIVNSKSIKSLNFTFIRRVGDSLGEKDGRSVQGAEGVGRVE